MVNEGAVRVVNSGVAGDSTGLDGAWLVKLLIGQGPAGSKVHWNTVFGNSAVGGKRWHVLPMHGWPPLRV